MLLRRIVVAAAAAKKIACLFAPTKTAARLIMMPLKVILAVALILVPVLRAVGVDGTERREAAIGTRRTAIVIESAEGRGWRAAMVAGAAVPASTIAAALTATSAEIVDVAAHRRQDRHGGSAEASQINGPIHPPALEI